MERPQQAVELVRAEHLRRQAEKQIEDPADQPAGGCGAFILGWTRDVTRFPTAAHYASYNGTAPREASSGSRIRHRVNRGGNRMLNHAIHIAAVTERGHDTPGRAYYLRKIAEGKTDTEALRALKRRVSDAVYRHLMADATR
ncbi:MAG: IS110 family transposase [Chloroflexi bacterium]|nr:IS110 family transposase [Chloroflexota bacterium]